MASNRRYRLLCPIARALDRVGDRWALLILRDLHAGPARFADLQSGLKGIAPNILSDRLSQLTADGLIQRRDAEHGLSLYELTDLGRRTRSLLFELAMFGAEFPPDPAPKDPGNYRTVAVTMAAAAERVASPDMTFSAEILIDEEPFALRLTKGHADMQAGRPGDAALSLATSYPALIAASEGETPLETFLSEQARITVDATRMPEAEQAKALLFNVLLLLRGELEAP